MHNLRARRPQHLFQIRKRRWDAEAFCQLSCHQRFLVTDRHEAAVWNPSDRLHMLVGDLAATHERYSQHRLLELIEKRDHRGLHRDPRLPSETLAEPLIGEATRFPLGGAPAPVECGGKLAV